ncbi:2-polyprenyl-3-methyl-6-methoxy-1,4-benzoquinone monooxygenase [Roseateles oligotrophus]|uniref:3-demethoxyubiquinol 3-hydroxylase n=1 Tax=Roseateles oligotrophus TaxID=1769250 RepID=A0ABT2YET1_9BURK|nr:2-polyprenyl-3-methyl-6-methoxy-1,4-benzoquinone monooxygenase [Roseateles oligotrophus]MCV2368536.1 2-polyprenyl-3-methyl-6-methoxy-1,4-benzoquinone monooxygenase [Roseateles oligotrophus]
MTSRPSLSKIDSMLVSVDHGLRTVFGKPAAARPSPAASPSAAPALSQAEAKLAGALMRVNHVGEICAQALYQSQALMTRDPELRDHFAQAAKEELDHLAWTQQRISELGSHTSHLSPLWYGGAFAIGCLAGLAGDRISLGFVVETERQVEQHLASHLDRLPQDDRASRAIVAQMKEEEARHAEEAMAAGAQAIPAPIKGLMRLAAHVMTRTAHYI